MKGGTKGKVTDGREEEKSKIEKAREREAGKGKGAKGETGARNVCVVSRARIQLFCDYNATDDWPAGRPAAFDHRRGASLRYTVLYAEIVILGDRFEYGEFMPRCPIVLTIFSRELWPETRILRNDE